MKACLNILALLVLVLGVCKTTNAAGTTLPEGRLGPNSIYYQTNTLIRLNARYTFPSPNSDKVSLWLLTRQPAQSSATDNPPLVLYDAASPTRNQSLLDHYQCTPSNENCAQMTVPRFGLQDIGVYSLQTRSANYLTFTYVSYNVSAYDLPMSLSCDNVSTCVYNATTQSLSVLPYQAINVTCSLIVVQNDEYPIPATLNFYSSNGEECASTPTTYTPIPSPIVSALYNQTTTNNLNFIRLSKTCQRAFTKQESSPNYACYLNPTPLEQSTPSILQQINTYEKLAVSLDINYGPDYSPSTATFNKTLILGQGTVFTCPFVGNPTPSYYWRVVSANTNNQTGANNRRILTPARDFSLSSQDYNVPKDLQLGTYVFECKSRVSGLVNKESQSVQFYLTVIPPPVIAKKASVSNFESRFIQNGSNIGAIVGGTVGGVAVLVIVVVLVIFLLKFRRHRKEPRDETEKPKELDIDITDGNPHLNPSSRNGAILNGSNLGEQAHQRAKQANGGIGHKVIAGLMVPTQTAQSYAAIAHAAAAAAQSNSFNQRNQQLSTANSSNSNLNGYISTNPGQSEQTTNHGTINANYNGGGSVNNLFSSSNHNLTNNKSQSYNNPGFFDSTTSYTIQNNLELPPPYDSALQQPVKKDSPIQQQQLIQHQQKDYMGSSSKLISGSNTPTQPKHTISHSYTAMTPTNLTLLSQQTQQTPQSMAAAVSLQQLQYHQQANLQYTTVQNLENRARSRNPLNGLSDMDQQQQQQQQQQYTTITTAMGQLSTTPIDV